MTICPADILIVICFLICYISRDYGAIIHDLSRDNIIFCASIELSSQAFHAVRKQGDEQKFCTGKDLALKRHRIKQHRYCKLLFIIRPAKL